MILKGSQRAGGTQLALHLLKTDENEHVDIHEVSGFISDTPMDAFKEAYAISRGTKCRQFLFSLSLSPPEKEIVPVEVFENAITNIENKIGLAGQPHVIVFHEKEGRRHAHCVWSRIDTEKMKAINLPHFKLKLRDISRELYLEHGWQMPRGLVNSEERNPLNFTQAEWQQAKRIKQDPRAIKEAFQDCWAMSDSRAAFAGALEERGYYLAKATSVVLLRLTGVVKPTPFPAGSASRRKKSAHDLAIPKTCHPLQKPKSYWRRNSPTNSGILLMSHLLHMKRLNTFWVINASHWSITIGRNVRN